MSQIAITIDSVSKQYRLGTTPVFNTLRDQIAHFAKQSIGKIGNHSVPIESPSTDSFWALKDVSFEVNHGEVIGIIGRNGAGKSTLLKLLSRITAPTSGRAIINGRVGSLLEVGTGFHPELSGRENIYMNGAILGMTKREMDNQFDAIVAFAEIEKFLDTPVKRYSSGMQLRLGFAVAAHLTPEILIVDEVLAVGDLAFQNKCLGKMKDVATSGRTVLLVSHNMSAIQRLCTRTCVLQSGRLIAFGETAEVVAEHIASTNTKKMAKVLTIEDLKSASKPDRIHFSHFSIKQESSPLTAMRNDKPIEVTIAYVLKREHRGLRIGFDLYDNEGLFLFRSFCDDDHRKLIEVQAPGEYTLTTQIPGNWLQSGSYNMFLTATVHMVEWITLNNVSVAFDVQYSGGPNEAYHDRRPGILLPMLDWRHNNSHGSRQ